MSDVPYYLARPDLPPGGNQPSLTGIGNSQDPNAQMVATLMQTLGISPQIESTPVPAPPHVRTWQRILGSIGDALAARAAVQSGGQPPPMGAFLAGLRQHQMEYEKALREATTSDVETRNKLRIGAFGEAAQRAREESVAKIRGEAVRAGKPLRFVPTTIDIDGVPTRVVDVYDPTTNEYLGRNTQGPAGYAPVVMPGMETDESGNTKPGIFRIPKTGKGGTQRIPGPAGAGLVPVPPEKAVGDIAGNVSTLQGLDVLSGAYDKIHTSTAGEGGFWDKAKQVAGTLIGETRFGGINEFSRPYAEYTAAKRASLNAYIKSITGAQFSVKELERYDSQYPEPWDPPELAQKKIQDLAQRSVSEMQTKLHAYPGAKPGGAKAPVRTIPRSAINALPEADRAETEAGLRAKGVVIDETK